VQTRLHSRAVRSRLSPDSKRACVNRGVHGGAVLENGHSRFTADGSSQARTRLATAIRAVRSFPW